MDTDERVLRVLSEAINTDAAALPRDCSLVERGLLDSMATVQLIAGLSDEFADAWATPQKIIDDIRRRLSAA